MSHRIAAVVVLYRPEPAVLLQLLRALAGDVERIFLFLNSAGDADFVADCAKAGAPTPIQTLGSGDNVGVGRAYNEAARAARFSGCDLLLLFDQDSSPPPGIAEQLAAAFDEAKSCFAPLALVGPRPVPPEAGPDYKLPFVKRGTGRSSPGLAQVAFLISSGSLLDLDAFEKIGPFREDFFIDAIDIEWCFRARARGFSCVVALRARMPHRLGGGVVAIALLDIRLIRQPPARLFTFARNQTAMMRLPHVPLLWKLRTVAALAVRLVVGLAGGLRRQNAGAILCGINAGLRRRLGPPVQAGYPGDE